MIIKNQYSQSEKQLRGAKETFLITTRAFRKLFFRGSFAQIRARPRGLRRIRGSFEIRFANIFLGFKAYVPNSNREFKSGIMRAPYRYSDDSGFRSSVLSSLQHVSYFGSNSAANIEIQAYSSCEPENESQSQFQLWNLNQLLFRALLYNTVSSVVYSGLKLLHTGFDLIIRLRNWE